MIITDGRNTALTANGYGDTHDVTAHTAWESTGTARQSFLFVVDGKRPDYSVGMTPYDVADKMIQHGAWNAPMLDSGGSSTMVVRDVSERRASSTNPATGMNWVEFILERNVANAIGIIVDNPSSRPLAVTTDMQMNMESNASPESPPTPEVSITRSDDQRVRESPKADGANFGNAAGGN